MATKHYRSELRPFGFRLSFEGKQELRRKSAAAGVSMSEYVRRAIDSYFEEIQIRKWFKSRSAGHPGLRP